MSQNDYTQTLGAALQKLASLGSSDNRLKSIQENVGIANIHDEGSESPKGTKEATNQFGIVQLALLGFRRLRNPRVIARGPAGQADG